MSDPPLTCIAFHEAGHAALHILLGRRFRYVTIVPDPEQGTLGHVRGYTSPPRFRPDIEVTVRGERYLRDVIMGLLAGELADQRHCGRTGSGSVTVEVAPYGTVIVDGDEHHAVDLASYVTDEDDDELEHYLAWLNAKTKNLLARPEVWAGVESLANALLDRHRLKYAEASDVYYAGVQAWSHAELLRRYPHGHPAFD